MDLERLWGKGGLVKKRGEVEEIDHMVDAMHRAYQLWEQKQKTQLTDMLARTDYGQSGAFWQFCQAMAESLINGNKEKQRLEGLLMGKDAYVRGNADSGPELEEPWPEQLRMELEK